MLDLGLRLAALFVLRIGPQDLPARYSALLLTIVAYAGLSLANATASPVSDGEPPIGPILASVIVSALLVRLVLALRGLKARWLQTLTALFGTAAVFHLVNLPLTAMMTDPPSAALAVPAVLLFFWSFAVDGHIYRNALHTSMSVGVLVAVAMFAVSYFILSTLLGRI